MEIVGDAAEVLRPVLPSQLYRRIHQGALALGAQIKQPFVDGAEFLTAAHALSLAARDDLGIVLSDDFYHQILRQSCSGKKLPPLT